MFMRGISLGIIVLLMASAGAVPAASAQASYAGLSSTDAYWLSGYSDQSSDEAAIYVPGTSYGSNAGYGSYYLTYGSDFRGSCSECRQCCKNFMPWYKRSPGVPAAFEIWASRQRLYQNQFLNLMSARWQVQMSKNRLWDSLYADPFSAKLKVQGVKDRLGALRTENEMYRQYGMGFDQAVDDGHNLDWSGAQSYYVRDSSNPYGQAYYDEEE